MAPATQAIRNNEVVKTEYSGKSAIDALYNELSKGIESLKKGDVYTKAMKPQDMLSRG